MAIEAWSGTSDEARTVGDLSSPDRLEKLLVLERVLAQRLEGCGARETAAISRELRECWREIEVLTGVDVEVADDELAARRERVAAARRAAAQAGASP